jgi:diguanylate cyclase with GGDEF domain/PucR-like helix-turn-helix protein
MERAILTRVYGISDPIELDDPEYANGVRTALSVAVDYALTAFEGGDGEKEQAIPFVLLGQARLAAQSGISLNVILRRYVAGFTVLGDFVLQEASESSPEADAASLQRLFHSHSALLDRLLDAVGAEHRRACDELGTGSADARRCARVKRLLEGELGDLSDFGYPLDGWHVAVNATGRGAAKRIRDSAARLDRILLLVEPADDTVWAWLGGRRRPDLGELLRQYADLAEIFCIAAGEPAEGIAGWRLTHRQAGAALSVAQHRGPAVVRYGEVVLLATTLQDDLLADSLRQLYLEPLENERDGGAGLRETLRAYIGASGSLSAAASMLSVSRRTVSNRICRVEEILGGSLHSVLAELDTALRFDEILRDRTNSRRSPTLAPRANRYNVATRSTASPVGPEMA